MSECGNPFCTCCHHAYLSGVRDGYALGFARGYRKGYANGYLDASLGLPPARLPWFMLSATEREEERWRRILRVPHACGCIGCCTCG
jgi:hypothetical protein